MIDSIFDALNRHFKDALNTSRVSKTGAILRRISKTADFLRNAEGLSFERFKPSNRASRESMKQ